jgi:hypothetical protein
VGGAAEFDATLVSVLQHRPDDCEVLLVHTEPYDDPYDLGSEVQFLRSGPSARLVELINEGLATAAGEVVHLLSCGVKVTEGWANAAVARFQDADIAAVSPLVMDADGQKLAAAGVRWTVGGSRQVVADQRVLSGGSARLRAGILGPTLAAGFFRREVLEALGSFDTRLDERYADVDLALAIAALDLRAVCEPASRVVRVAPLEDQRRAAFSRGRNAERIFWRNAAARGMFPSLVMHPFALLGDILATRSALGAGLAALGRTLALLELGATRRHEERLAGARAALSAAEERATIPLSQGAARDNAVASSQSRRRAA